MPLAGKANTTKVCDAKWGGMLRTDV